MPISVALSTFGGVNGSLFTSSRLVGSTRKNVKVLLFLCLHPPLLSNLTPLLDSRLYSNKLKAKSSLSLKMYFKVNVFFFLISTYGERLVNIHHKKKKCPIIAMNSTTVVVLNMGPNNGSGKSKDMKEEEETLLKHKTGTCI